MWLWSFWIQKQILEEKNLHVALILLDTKANTGKKTYVQYWSFSIQKWISEKTYMWYWSFSIQRQILEEKLTCGIDPSASGNQEPGKKLVQHWKISNLHGFPTEGDIANNQRSLTSSISEENKYLMKARIEQVVITMEVSCGISKNHFAETVLWCLIFRDSKDTSPQTVQQKGHQLEIRQSMTPSWISYKSVTQLTFPSNCS